MSFDGILGTAKLRRIASITGLDPVRGWAWGRQWEFVTADHVHYLLAVDTDEWHVIEDPTHFTSCRAFET